MTANDHKKMHLQNKAEMEKVKGLSVFSHSSQREMLKEEMKLTVSRFKQLPTAIMQYGALL